MSSTHNVTFHYFPHLPVELRLQIWRLSVYPRTVHMREKFQPDKMMRYLVSSTPPPAIMHACQESRSEIVSSGIYTAACVNAEIGPHFVWIDFVHDTVRLGDTGIGLIKEEERAQIRKTIIEVKETGHFLHFVLEEDMIQMRALRELDILSEPPLWSWGWNFRCVQRVYEEAFGTQSGWEPPRIRLIESATGEEMTASNYFQKAFALRGRGNRGRTAGTRGAR